VPNTLAFTMLFGWPVVCVILFVMLPVEMAAITSLLGGYLLLPSATSLDVSYLPPLDKSTIPALSTLLLCLMKGSQSRAPRTSLLIYFFAFCFVVSPIFTTQNNMYELRIGDRSIPGFYPLDGVKLALQNILTLAPFFVGMRYLSSDNGRALLIRSIPIATLFYSVPMLFELRFSPQLQRLIYGAIPGGFIQLARAGGYRPLVFLSTALELALFTSMAMIAAIVAMRARWRFFHLPAGAVAAYLAALLLLCKTLGAFLYGVFVAPLVLFTRPKTWVRISCVIALVICAYPLLRNYDLIPVRRVAAAASTVSAERGGSFAFRVLNEDRLLARANQKPFFGWGTWGRNRIYNQESGADESITDGAWILRFGMFGWFCYLALFGLFAAAMFGALAGVKGPVTQSTVVLGGLTIMLAVNLIDLLPNANLVPLTYLLAGSIAARARVRSTKTAKPRPQRATVASPVPELAE
jgi:hypothetical protein